MTVTKRGKRAKLISKVLAYIILSGLSVIYILPFLWLVSTSLKPDHLLYKFPPVWIPNPIQWSNYPKALQYITFFTYLKNTLTICTFATLGTLISCSLVAYSFARIDWDGRDIFFIVMLSTMMIPYQVTMIPLFIVFKKLNWLNTFRPLIIPYYFGSPFYIFLLRQFFMTIPIELADAARIDGCSELGIYRRVILPLSKPALATVALFSFVAHWHDFLAPLIYLKDDTKYTLSLGLQQFQRQYGAEWSLLMATSVVITIPIIILFFFTQRTYIQGITLTGMKG